MLAFSPLPLELWAALPRAVATECDSRLVRVDHLQIRRLGDYAIPRPDRPEDFRFIDYAASALSVGFLVGSVDEGQRRLSPDAGICHGGNQCRCNGPLHVHRPQPVHSPVLNPRLKGVGIPAQTWHRVHVPREGQASAALTYARHKRDLVTATGVRVLDSLNLVG